MTYNVFSGMLNPSHFTSLRIVRWYLASSVIMAVVKAFITDHFSNSCKQQLVWYVCVCVQEITFKQNNL